MRPLLESARDGFDSMAPLGRAVVIVAAVVVVFFVLGFVAGRLFL